MNRWTVWIALTLVGWPCLGEAADLVWDRNVEPDMSHYNIYLCQGAGCTVTTANRLATVPQVGVGVVPMTVIPAGMEGALAVTAVDTSGNESGLSVSVPFDTVVPAIPVNPRRRP